MFHQIIAQITDHITLPENYWQIIMGALAISLSWLAAYHIKKRFLLLRVAEIAFGKNNSILHLVTKYCRPLLFPVFCLTLLSIVYMISDKLFAQGDVTIHMLQLIILWLTLRFIQLFSESTFIAILIGLILIPLVLLNITNLLDPTTAFLDQYAITVGNIRISAYTVIKAIVVLSLVFWLAGALSRGSKTYLNKVGLKSRTRALMSKFFDIILYSIVILVTLNVIGVDLTALAVIGGAIGVGIGFGLQKITSNFISGIILIFERSVDANDLVELEGGIYGWIRHLGARYTLVETLDGKEIMIPNEDFITGRVVNWTFSNAEARINIPVGVSYKSDIKLARDLMIEAANEYQHTLTSRPPVCHLREFGDSSVNFELRFWLKDIKITKGPYDPQSEVMFAIWDKFQENGIEIPFPQRDVHLKDAGPISVRLEEPA